MTTMMITDLFKELFVEIAVLNDKCGLGNMGGVCMFLPSLIVVVVVVRVSDAERTICGSM